jgi:hypothetical protein
VTSPASSPRRRPGTAGSQVGVTHLRLHPSWSVRSTTLLELHPSWSADWAQVFESFRDGFERPGLVARSQLGWNARFGRHRSSHWKWIRRARAGLRCRRRWRMNRCALRALHAGWIANCREAGLVSSLKTSAAELTLRLSGRRADPRAQYPCRCPCAPRRAHACPRGAPWHQSAQRKSTLDLSRSWPPASRLPWTPTNGCASRRSNGWSCHLSASCDSVPAAIKQAVAQSPPISI